MKDRIIEKVNEVLDLELSRKIYQDFIKTKLENKVIKLTIEDSSFQLLLNFEDEKVCLSGDCEDVDVEISGTFTSFVFYAFSGGSDLFSSKIKISGDIETANSLNSFFRDSNIIRVIIVELIGQKSSSTIFSLIKPIKTMLEESNENNKDSLSNFLKYDVDLIPTREEIDNYIDQVDEIKRRTEKLIKRIK